MVEKRALRVSTVAETKHILQTYREREARVHLSISDEQPLYRFT